MLNKSGLCDKASWWCVLAVCMITFAATPPHEAAAQDARPATGPWRYIQVDDSRAKWGDWDDPEWLRYFGLDMRDMTGDGMLDIVAGRYVYINPGGDMTAPWVRYDLGMNMDGMLAMDVDGDERADIIATALPTVFWLEADERSCAAWTAREVADIPATAHVNGQGYRKAQILPGGREEILLSSGDGIWCLSIPDDPERGGWKAVRVAQGASEEGIGVGDIDGDGLVDIAAGCESGREYYLVFWWRNPGDGSGDWAGRHIGNTVYSADRLEVSDIDGDGLNDIIVSEERWPGEDPDASLFWFRHPGDIDGTYWSRYTVVSGEYSLNNLDVADMDMDGDPDIVTCEHKGDMHRLQIFLNDGAGSFTLEQVDRGRESHLGARTADMDGDGDLDIVGIGWDVYNFLHLWRNDAR